MVRLFKVPARCGTISGKEGSVKCISVENWDKYQARKDKDLPWCKLWGSLFTKYWWQSLPDDQKILPIIFLDLSRRFGNQIPKDPDYLARNYGLKIPLETIENCLKLLIQNKFLSDKCLTDKSDRSLSISLSVLKKKKGDTGEKEKSFKKDFETIWMTYPNRIGKKQATKHYQTSVKTTNDVKACLDALENYKKHLAVNTWKAPQNGATWFNNWRDWVDYQEPERRETDEERSTRILAELKQ